MRRLHTFAGGLAVLLGGLAVAGQATALDEVSFGTNWVAQAEHGGFYQALADGTYEEFGLDVTIRQGGPQVGNRNLLIAGRLDFYMGGNLIEPFNAVKESIPTIVVAAMFQKDPQVILAHPDRGIEDFEDLAALDTLFLSNYGFITFFQWMLSEYSSFREEQHRPYAFNPMPFIVDPNSAQQGYVTSEPYQIEREAGWTPKIFLLADHGFDTYSTLIETTHQLLEENPEIVQRFVDASIIGWYTYLYGDNSAGNALIKQENPEMTDDLIAYSLDKMHEFGIVDSGIARERGIGCMEEQRVRSFFERMVRAGVTDGNIEPSHAFTSRFVCTGTGLDLRAELTGE